MFTTRLDAAAAAALPSIVLPSYDAVVGILLELHYYFNISKSHDAAQQLFTTSNYITCAADGLAVFGSCTDIARGSKAINFSVLYSIPRVYSEYRVSIIFQVF